MLGSISDFSSSSRFRFVSRQARMLVWHPQTEEFIPRDHAFTAKLARPCRCGWSSIAIILLSLNLAVVPSTSLFVQSTSPSSNLSFPEIRSPDDFITFGGVQYNPDKLSFTIDTSGPAARRVSCAKLFFKDKVRMKDRESSAVASFSTSFTFSITQQEHSTNRSGWLGHVCGFVFCLAQGDLSSMYGGFWDSGVTGAKYFAVEIDTYNNYLDEDPSDNHIGVNINNPQSVCTFNLCEGQRTNCSFPWTDQAYTAWIDYNGSTRSLEIWFANGSLADGVIKPAGSGVIKVPELDLTGIFEDHMYVGFSGSSGLFLEAYEILSWNFASSYIEEMGGGIPNSTSRILMTCAAFGTAILAAISLLGYYSRRQPCAEKSEPGLGLDFLLGLRRFSFEELKKATKNFNESALLGKGGFASVYKGTLQPSGTVVAVKRLKHDSEHVKREFLAEVSSISQIRHRNLVHLQGWCHEDGHFLLVFDYMSNGSLDEWLFPSGRRHPLDPKYKTFEVLSWELRFSILAGVAAAVEYLHEEWVQCVLHRDIKSSNVMLDADFNPHLGDFGLARLIDHKKLEKTTMVAGTFGYMAPELHYTGKATKESDVYSFGILMLEVVCGRRPINLQVEDPDDDFLLMQSVWRAHEAGNILSAVDPRLLEILHLHQLEPSLSCSKVALQQSILLTNSILEAEPAIELLSCSSTESEVTAGATRNLVDEKKIVSLLHLGLQCCLLDPESRPSMRIVKQEIQGSTAEDSITKLSSMPPLPSAMPVYGSLPGVPKSSNMAMKVHPDKVDASFSPRSDTVSMLRHRFQSG